MSGLFGTLSIALSSLTASQQELATTSNNVANANTPGFSRQRPVVVTGAPIVEASLSFGTGVVLQKIQSLRDPILEIQLNQATQQQSQLNASLGQLQQLQTQFASSTSGIGADISNFFNSLQQLAPDPSNLELRQGVLTAAGNLATDFNTTANNLQTQRSNLDLNVVQSVSDVNTLTAQIASVNQQISSLQNAGQDPSTLVDTQTTLIRQLSALVGVSVIPTDQGISLALSNGTALVSGSQSFALSTQLGNDNVQHIMVGSQDITGPAGRGTLVRVDPVRHVAAEGSVSVIDLAATQSTAGEVPTGPLAHESNVGETPTKAAETAAPLIEIETGLHACAMAASPNGRWIGVANAGSDTLSVIDTRTDKIIETIYVRQNPGDLFGAQPNALAFDKVLQNLANLHVNDVEVGP